MTYGCEFTDVDGKPCEEKSTLGYEALAEKVLCYRHRMAFFASLGNKAAKEILTESGDGVSGGLAPVQPEARMLPEGSQLPTGGSAPQDVPSDMGTPSPADQEEDAK